MKKKVEQVEEEKEEGFIQMIWPVILRRNGFHIRWSEEIKRFNCLFPNNNWKISQI